MKVNMSPNSFSYILICTSLMAILWTGRCDLYTSIQWDPLNPIFKPSQEHNNYTTHHINMEMMSKIHIICPNVAVNPVKLSHPRNRDSLYENIWIVTKKAFDSCKVNVSDSENRLLYKCDEPVDLNYKILTFKKDMAMRGDLVFEHGKHYYFMATSNGSVDSLDNHEKGHCKTHNMKFQIYICNEQNDPKCKAVEENGPRGTSSTPTTAKDEKQTEGKTAKNVKCFLSAGDKIWLIAVGVVVGVVLVLCLGGLIFTCCRKRRSNPRYYEDGGQVPLKEKPENNGV